MNEYEYKDKIMQSFKRQSVIKTTQLNEFRN